LSGFYGLGFLLGILTGFGRYRLAHGAPLSGMGFLLGFSFDRV
jgi:hypothetical protein